MATPSTPDKDARLWGMLAHLAAFSGFIGIPLGTILGPLIVWMVKKDEMPFVNDQGKESLNFQLSMLVYGLIICVVAGVGVIVTLLMTKSADSTAIAFFVIFPLMFIASVFGLIVTIIGAVQANQGIAYRYPLNLRLIK